MAEREVYLGPKTRSDEELALDFLTKGTPQQDNVCGRCRGSGVKRVYRGAGYLLCSRCHGFGIEQGTTSSGPH